MAAVDPLNACAGLNTCPWRVVAAAGVSSSAQHVDAALGFLCFANVPPPLPSPWVEAHQLLWGALAAGLDMREHQEEANRLQEVLEHLNTDW